jgi:hypothetical protein
MRGLLYTGLAALVWMTVACLLTAPDLVFLLGFDSFFLRMLDRYQIHTLIVLVAVDSVISVCFLNDVRLADRIRSGALVALGLLVVAGIGQIILSSAPAHIAADLKMPTTWFLLALTFVFRMMTYIRHSSARPLQRVARVSTEASGRVLLDR